MVRPPLRGRQSHLRRQPLVRRLCQPLQHGYQPPRAQRLAAPMPRAPSPFKTPEPLNPPSWDFRFWTLHIWGQASIKTVKAPNRPNSRRKRREKKDPCNMSWPQGRHFPFDPASTQHKPSHRNPQQVGILHTALSHLVHHTSRIDKTQSIICHNDMWPPTFHMCFLQPSPTYNLLRFFFSTRLVAAFCRRKSRLFLYWPGSRCAKSNEH